MHDDATARRFWAKVDREGSGCWLWTAARSPQGYGFFGVPRGNGGPMKIVRSHRVAYEIANGPIPDGLWVLHTCDNPPCVRPEHLYAGTRRNNMDDAIARGRTAKGKRQGRHLVKLTEAQVQDIRRLRRTGMSLSTVARTVGTSKRTVLNIVQGTTWRWLTEDVHGGPAA